MSGEHTPGPWEIEGTGCILRTKTGVNDRGGMTGGVGIAQFFGLHKPDEADARLIAAAPDLLEALRELRGWMPPAGDDRIDASLRKADAAIAKAEGRILSPEAPASSKEEGE
ncbi:hypothetical protein [Aureimonas sp. ME7]|uniref:hypothetical protein n=1 Tax=Aureimonas sp. ME7 TaxID=2744252 RepID=UPI0015F88104|nr:hypothetical protein [Aureimonas sp. ME7]